MNLRIDWAAAAPGLAQFRGYQRSWLRGDVLAGLTVVAYLVPQAMAYATVAGLAPVAGLWASLLPLLIYSVMGSSRYLSAGTESSTALMTATALVDPTMTDFAAFMAFRSFDPSRLQVAIIMMPTAPPK